MNNDLQWRQNGPVKSDLIIAQKHVIIPFRYLEHIPCSQLSGTNNTYKTMF